MSSSDCYMVLRLELQVVARRSMTCILKNQAGPLRRTAFVREPNEVQTRYASRRAFEGPVRPHLVLGKLI